MFAYATLGTNDFEKSKAYYTELLEPLGAKMVMDNGRMAMFSCGRGQPMLGICTPFDEKVAKPGNGTMLALVAASREQVDALYDRALALGGTDEGAPGERTASFYGGYFRDLDGNKAVFCHMG